MKTTHNRPDPKDKIVKMGDMMPCQFGQITTKGVYLNCVVMRTSSIDTFEVMELSNLVPDFCWTTKTAAMKVRLFEKGESITLTQD